MDSLVCANMRIRVSAPAFHAETGITRGLCLGTQMICSMIQVRDGRSGGSRSGLLYTATECHRNQQQWMEQLPFASNELKESERGG